MQGGPSSLTGRHVSLTMPQPRKGLAANTALRIVSAVFQARPMRESTLVRSCVTARSRDRVNDTDIARASKSIEKLPWLTYSLCKASFRSRLPQATLLVIAGLLLAVNGANLTLAHASFNIEHDHEVDHSQLAWSTPARALRRWR